MTVHIYFHVYERRDSEPPFTTAFDEPLRYSPFQRLPVRARQHALIAPEFDAARVERTRED